VTDPSIVKRTVEVPEGETVPQGLKPAIILLPFGAAEAVPFQNKLGVATPRSNRKKQTRGDDQAPI
jgi:hypothetical protein